MDLMTLAAKITLDDSSYEKGIVNAEKMGQQLAGKMSAMTVAVGNIAADMVRKAAGAVKNVISGAIDGYADYQQLIGGVETLFKKSAGKVAKYAEQSYKTTGLSANQYMETVTSFSASLLQGLGGDTEQAAEMANTAIQDMADNANKMGTDISSIQAAYQGFAKQNYTMLDNLKLGYGGTAGEMIRLVNDSKILDHEIESLDDITFDQLVLAIHQIQSEMGITGTTAKEAASTISGSKASLSAAWSDFLAAIGGEEDQAKIEKAGENFKGAFETYVKDNLAPAINTTMKNTPELIDAVKDAITSLPSQAVTDLVSNGIDILTSTVEGATAIAGWLIDGLVGLFDPTKADQSKISELGNAVGTFIGSALSDIVTNAPKIIPGLFAAGVNLAGSLIEGLFSGLFGLNEKGEVAEAFSEATEEMNDSITEAVQNSVKAQGIVEYLEGLVETYGKMASQTEEWKKAITELDKVMPGAGKTIEGYGSHLDRALQKITELNEQTKQMAIEEAKRQALEKKHNAMIAAQAKVWSAETDIMISESAINEARQGLESLFAGKIFDSLTGEAVNVSLAGLSGEQLEHAVWSYVNEATGGAGNQAYEDMKPVVQGYLNTITEQQAVYDTASATIKDLNDQLVIAKTDYQIASDALEKLTAGAESAAKALETVAPPARYGGGSTYDMPKATGIDFVPYSGFRASLHRGEAVITASENEKRRNGEGSAEIVGAIQEMRADLQNLRLVVGQKTFGKAVVDYGGRRTMEYIGQAESRGYAGYGT